MGNMMVDKRGQNKPGPAKIRARPGGRQKFPLDLIGA